LSVAVILTQKLKLAVTGGRRAARQGNGQRAASAGALFFSGVAAMDRRARAMSMRARHLLECRAIYQPRET
jgi:hypothetical protein